MMFVKVLLIDKETDKVKIKNGKLSQIVGNFVILGECAEEKGRRVWLNTRDIFRMEQITEGEFESAKSRAKPKV